MEEDELGGGGMDDMIGGFEEEEEVVEEELGEEGDGIDILNADQVDVKAIAEENFSTTPYMTKYERARVLGTRALQIR